MKGCSGLDYREPTGISEGDNCRAKLTCYVGLFKLAAQGRNSDEDSRRELGDAALACLNCPALGKVWCGWAKCG